MLIYDTADYLNKRLPIYKPKHFKIYELVYPELYNEYVGKDKEWILWRRFDKFALVVIDRLREQFGRIIINDWKWGGGLKYSGVRPLVIPKGEHWSKYTTHVDFNTFDLHPKNIGIKDLYEHIIRNATLYKEITVMEHYSLTPTWLHISTCNFGDTETSIRIIRS